MNDKIQELSLAAFAAFAGISAWICKRLFNRVDQAHTRIDSLESKLVDREYLQTQIEPIQDNIQLILEVLLQRKKD